jgi:hypothetical protein
MNGVGVHFFSVLNTVLLMASQYIISTVVVLIGWGWTLSVMEVD